MKKVKNNIRILAIDPATSLLGWAMIDFNPITNIRTVIRTGLIKGTYHAKKKKDLIVKYFPRIIALEVIEEDLKEIIETFEPDYITCEDAFMNRKFPNAFPALLSCVVCIEMLLYKVFQMTLYKYAPRHIKAIFTGNGNAGKALIKSSVLSSDNIIFKQQSLVDNSKISEHEFDAIAIGSTFIDTDLNTLRVN